MSDSDAASIASSFAPRDIADEYDNDDESLLSVQEVADEDIQSELREEDERERRKRLEQAMTAVEKGAVEEEREDLQDDDEIPSPPATPRPVSARNSYDTGVWRGGSLEQQAPLLDAPPDYAQAVGYRTFSAAYRRRGHGDERGSFATPEDNDDGDEPPKKLHNYVRRNWPKVCILNLAIYSLLVTVVLVIKHFATQHTGASVMNSVKYPDHVESWGSNWRPDTHDRAKFHRSTSECEFDSFRTMGYSQGMRMANFTFVESIVPNSNYSDFQVSGNIDIRPAPYDQHEAAVIWVSIATTSPWKAVAPTHDYLDDGSVFRFPRLERIDSPEAGHISSRNRDTKKPCLDFFMGIYVRNSFDLWNMSSTVGNVNIGYPESFDPEMNWFFYVLKKARISTTKGNISADYLFSPNVDLGTTEGSIKGNYSFDDSMSVTTKSGEIDVLINQSARRSPKAYASTLNSSSVTGDIRVSLHHEDWPDEWVPRMEQYNLQSYHQSRSGNLFLNFTGWQGFLGAHTGPGSSIDIRGTNLTDCTDSEGRVPDTASEKNVCVTRGSLNSTARVESVSGDVQVSLGDHLEYWPAVTV